MRVLKFKPAITERQCRRRQRKRTRNLADMIVALGLIWAVSGVHANPGRLDFPSVPAGSASEPQKIRLTNRGTAEVRFSTFEFQGKDATAFAVHHDGCDRLASGASCDLTVEFQPSEPVLQRARLVIDASNGEQLTTNLAGRGMVASVVVNPGAVSFGNVTVGESSNQQVTVQGEGWFHVHNVALTGSGAREFGVDKETCLDNRPRFKSCGIALIFHPDAPGGWEAELKVDDDGAGSPHVVKISGNAIFPETTTEPPARASNTARSPAIRVEPTMLEFSSIDQKPKTVRVLNDGQAPLRVSASVAGTDPDRFAADASACAAAIPAGEDCSIVISYNRKLWKPQPSYSAQLDLKHDAPNTSTISVALRWEKAAPPPRANVTVNPGSLTFLNGAVPLRKLAAQAAPQEQTITIHNGGPVPVNQLNLRLGIIGQGENGAFTHSNNCHQLAVNQDCTETVSFNPKEMKAAKEALYIFDGPLNRLATVNLEAPLPEAPK